MKHASHSLIPSRHSVKRFIGLRRADTGQSLVEFALILPLFLFLVLAAVDFGWGLRAYIVETNAAREGARYWAINGSPSGGCSDISTVVNARATTLSSLTITEKIDNTTTTTCTATSPSAVTVTVSYNYSYVTPLGGVFHLISGGTLGSPLTMSTSATMRVE